MITANGSILSGQLPREQGGGGLAGSLINLEDSKSVCSCSCQPVHCFPCFTGRRHQARRAGGGVEFGAYAAPGGASVVGRSYGALSNTGTFSAASLGACDNDVLFIERYTPASVVGTEGTQESGHQVPCFDCDK